MSALLASLVDHLGFNVSAVGSEEGLPPPSARQTVRAVLPHTAFLKRCPVAGGRGGANAGRNSP